MHYVIRLGDKTSHGGEVVSATDNYSVMGKAVARVGDYCTCPIKGHGKCQIVSGDPYWSIDGRAVAIQGISKTSCGAELISSCGELERSFEGEAAAGRGVMGSLAHGDGIFPDSQDEPMEMWFDEKVRLLVEATHAQGVPFHIEIADGRVLSGYTDSGGAMPRINTEEQSSYQVYLYDEALAHMEGDHGSK